MAKNSRFLKKNNSKIQIFGHHATIAALKNENRILKRLIMSENASKLIDKKLLSKVKKIEIISNKEFNERFNNKGENKQGIILEASNLIPSSFSSILQKTNKEKYSILLMLDQIQNPQNIGSIIRSAALFNCRAVITSKNNSPDMNSTIVKSSSGATEVVEYIKVGNLVRSINEAKKSGFWIIGFEQNEKTTIDKFDIPNKCIFILGSEHHGLRNLTKEKCDYLVSINFSRNRNFNIDSLNVSNAAAIALYEYRKKIND